MGPRVLAALVLLVAAAPPAALPARPASPAPWSLPWRLGPGGPPRRGPPPATRTPTARCLPEWPPRGLSARLFCGG